MTLWKSRNRKEGLLWATEIAVINIQNAKYISHNVTLDERQ